MFQTVAIIFSLLLAILRIGGAKQEAFQAVAHLWVGFLIYGWAIDKTALAKWLVISLSVVELSCFIYFKFISKN